MMCGFCKGVSGLLILVAGLLLLLSGLGNINMMSANTWAGILIGLYGLGMLLHAGNLCPKCK